MTLSRNLQLLFLLLLLPPLDGPLLILPLLIPPLYRSTPTGVACYVWRMWLLITASRPGQLRRSGEVFILKSVRPRWPGQPVYTHSICIHAMLLKVQSSRHSAPAHVQTFISLRARLVRSVKCNAILCGVSHHSKHRCGYNKYNGEVHSNGRTLKHHISTMITYVPQQQHNCIWRLAKRHIFTDTSTDTFNQRLRLPSWLNHSRIF